MIQYAVPENHCPEWSEAYCIPFVQNGGITELHIAAGVDLGLVYGKTDINQNRKYHENAKNYKLFLIKIFR